MRSGNERKTGRARLLRQADNEAEEALWSELRGRRLNGFKFLRQMPIGPYFADFACREANLVVEVDGSGHVGSVRDLNRDRTMALNGWNILRIWNADVLSDRKSVLETIIAAHEHRFEEDVQALDMKYIMRRVGN